jgi:hypothetical protein
MARLDKHWLNIFFDFMINTMVHWLTLGFALMVLSYAMAYRYNIWYGELIHCPPPKLFGWPIHMV